MAEVDGSGLSASGLSDIGGTWATIPRSESVVSESLGDLLAELVERGNVSAAFTSLSDGETCSHPPPMKTVGEFALQKFKEIHTDMVRKVIAKKIASITVS